MTEEEIEAIISKHPPILTPKTQEAIYKEAFDMWVLTQKLRAIERLESLIQDCNLEFEKIGDNVVISTAIDYVGIGRNIAEAIHSIEFSAENNLRIHDLLSGEE